MSDINIDIRHHRVVKNTIRRCSLQTRAALDKLHDMKAPRLMSIFLLPDGKINNSS